MGNGTTPDSSNGGEPPKLDAADANAMDQARSFDPNSPVAETEWAQIQRIEERAADKARLAETLSANTYMRVDPAVVDDLASFFEEKSHNVGRAPKGSYSARRGPAARN